MSMNQRVTGLFFATMIGLAAVSCSSDDGGGGEPAAVTFDESTDDGATSTTDGAPSDEAPGDGAEEGPEEEGASASPGDVITVDDPVLSDGIWAVGDAGTVEFAIVDEDGLELIEAVPNDGWEMDVEVDSPNEIEVEFDQDGREYQIEIEIENGILEVEIDLDIDPAEPGTFDLGPAGTVELAVDGGSVTLVDLTPAGGWNVTEQDTDDGEVDIELRQDNVRWELDAEVDDGQLEVEIDFEIEGAVS